MSEQGSGGNVLAAICSFFVPGLGQLVQGRILAAIIFFLLVSVNYSLAATGILFFMATFGFIFHVWAIINAARYKG
ncbi:MAG: TM2 domain-containing membrane protein YozV [Flavobacteriales bacterium]|jgi:TM2 domain-containing membrane protein YozV